MGVRRTGGRGAGGRAGMLSGVGAGIAAAADCALTADSKALRAIASASAVTEGVRVEGIARAEGEGWLEEASLILGRGAGA
jgi:hypothetical protein